MKTITLSAILEDLQAADQLQATFPHHRHEPPDIKHNRRPAPGISFQAPNLPTLIKDCVELGAKMVGAS